MVWLNNFTLPTREQEEAFFRADFRSRMTYYSTNYPFGLFAYRQMPTFEFSDVTIFCGNNGCGKSTILNVIGDALKLERKTPYNRTEFFEGYVNLCRFTLRGDIPPGSEIITSDGVFEKLLDIRQINDGIDTTRQEMMHEYMEMRKKKELEPNLLLGLDDYVRWKRERDKRSPKTSLSSYIRQNLSRNIQERSNGESALAFFVDAVRDGKLYLLDEPENSLSPANQLLLKGFIEDCVRNHGCQFVISTHSPFLLSIAHATIYDIGEKVTRVTNWSELESVRTYFEFFKSNEWRFEQH